MGLNLPALISLVTFIAVIAIIISDKIHLNITALLGALILVFAHVMTLKEAMKLIKAMPALFFGIMVLVRAFEPTKVFEYIATQMVILAKVASFYCWQSLALLP